MGQFFSGSNTTNSTQTSTPLGWQSAPVQDLFGNTQNLENSQQGLQYNGQLYAGWNPTEQSGAGMYVNNGQAASGYASPMLQAGMSGVTGLPTATNGYTNFSNGNFNQGTTAAGNAAMGNASSAVGMGNTGLSTALSGINNNTAGNVENAANSYINNNVLNGQINAVGTDISRNLGQQINGLNSSAAVNGNEDSSRAGAAQAIYTSQAQENLANAAANIRGNAYNTGLNLAEGQNVANINSGINAGSVGNQMTNTALTGQNANNYQTNAVNSAMLQGDSGLVSGANTGTTVANTGNNLGVSGAGQVYQGGLYGQQNQQGQDTANYNSFMLNNETLPWASLNNASSILQARNWGGTQTGQSTTQSTSSPFGDILGGLSLAGGLGAFGSSGLGGLFGGGATTTTTLPGQTLNGGLSYYT